MSSSSKKKRALVSCATCDCSLLARDKEKHSNLCSGDVPLSSNLPASFPANIRHNFLLPDCLYGTVQLQPLPQDFGSKTKSWLTDNVMFLHPTVMAQLGVNFKTPCLIVNSDGKAQIGIVLPNNTLPLLTVGVTKNNNFALGDNDFVCVTRVSANVEKCNRLALLPLEDKRFFDLPEFTFFLREYFNEAYIKRNSYVQLQYFGQTVRLFVQSANSSDLVNCMECLELKDNNRSDECLDTQPAACIASSDSQTIIPRWKSFSSGEYVQLHLNTEYLIQRNIDTNVMEAPKINFDNIGGLKDVKQQLIEHLVQPMSKSLAGQKALGVRSILLYGPSGCGKSLLVAALGQESSAHSKRLSATQILSRFYAESEKLLNGVLEELTERRPSVFIIEDLHVLLAVGSSEAQQSEAALKLSGLFCDFMDQLKLRTDIWFVTNTHAVDRISSNIRRRFDLEIEVSVPSANDRKEILEKLLAEHQISDADLESIASVAHGYTGSDLEAVCKQASSGKLELSLDSLKQALCAVRPSAMREITLEVPRVRWSDIGGNEQLKLQLRQALEWPTKHADAFKRLGVAPPTGVLLYGPPGCSKTLIARALATESGLNFLAVKGPELFSKWVGESERAVRQLFARARQAAPAVVFFDEIDALAVSRSGGNVSAVGDRVLAQLLTEMDGLESVSGVTVVAATNRPDVIDPALIRPGRLDKLLYVPLPDQTTRDAIFQLQFQKTPAGADVDVEQLVQWTDGYSGAEVVAICKEAALIAMRENIEAERVQMEHLKEALRVIRPRTDKSMLVSYEDFASSCLN